MSSSRGYHELVHQEPGDPLHVLSFAQHDDNDDSHALERPTNANIKVSMIAAPWNPADVNQVEGTYPSPYPDKEYNPQSARGDGSKVAGSEGWGKIVESDCADLKPGDYVVPAASGLGTMRNCLFLNDSQVIKVERGAELSEKVGPWAASTLFQLGGTALRMLRDFVVLQPGDLVVQNGGNSAVGFVASQLAVNVMGCKMASMVRRGEKDDEEVDAMVDFLVNKGRNDEVMFFGDKKTNKGQVDRLSDGKGGKLGLNAIGGQYSTAILKLMGEGATLVTYGGMSKEPVQVSTGQLIFSEKILRGYWHSRWMIHSSPQRRHDLIQELVDFVLNDQLTLPPIQVFPLYDFEQALSFEQSGQIIRNKIVFDCQAVNEFSSEESEM